jgi:hypothetical protein
MTETNEATPDFKDRTLGLMIFGVISILIGVFCALLVPLMFLSEALSESVAGAGVNSRSAWSASALYGILAVVFVWLGIGSIRARRWARELLLSVSWIWLLTGICSLIIGILVPSCSSTARHKSPRPVAHATRTRSGSMGVPGGSSR